MKEKFGSYGEKGGGVRKKEVSTGGHFAGGCLNKVTYPPVRRRFCFGEVAEKCLLVLTKDSLSKLVGWPLQLLKVP